VTPDFCSSHLFELVYHLENVFGSSLKLFLALCVTHYFPVKLSCGCHLCSYLFDLACHLGIMFAVADFSQF